jgi:hypothetical protein
MIGLSSVCVCVYMWWYSQEPTYSGPYPPTFQVPKVNSLVNDTVVTYNFVTLSADQLGGSVPDS